MWIDFDELPDHARIWIYQSDREFDDELTTRVMKEIQSFIDKWEAHGKELRASASILYNRFLVIGLDESFNQVTGCSTDASVNFVRALGNELGIDFFDRLKMPVIIDEKVELIELDRFRKKELPSAVSESSFTFDNLIQEKSQLDKGWKKPVSDTWLAKYM
jgi:hypothetical protein